MGGERCTVLRLRFMGKLAISLKENAIPYRALIPLMSVLTNNFYIVQCLVISVVTVTVTVY